MQSWWTEEITFKSILPTFWMIVYVYPKSTLKSAKHSSILTHLEIHTLSSYTFSAYAWTQYPLQVISCQAFEGFITRTAVSRVCHPAQENLYFRHRFWYLIRSSHLCFGSDALTWRAQYFEECLKNKSMIPGRNTPEGKNTFVYSFS